MSEDIKPGYVRISDVASAYAGHGKIPKKIMDYAADRGTRVHELIYDKMNMIVINEEQYYFCGKNLAKRKEDEKESYFDSFLKFWEPYDSAPIIQQEQRLYDDHHMTTGQIDLVFMMDGKKTLIDWKTSRDVCEHWLLQASGYSLLLWANGIVKDPVERYLFVKLDKDGKPPIVTEYVPDTFMFKQALELYNRFMKDQQCNFEDE